MSVPTYSQLYEAGMTALLSIVQGGKSEATFQGRKYTALDVMELQKTVELFRRMAIQAGEITTGVNQGPVNVSTVWITDPYLYQ